MMTREGTQRVASRHGTPQVTSRPTRGSAGGIAAQDTAGDITALPPLRPRHPGTGLSGRHHGPPAASRSTRSSARGGEFLLERQDRLEEITVLVEAGEHVGALEPQLDMTGSAIVGLVPGHRG